MPDGSRLRTCTTTELIEERRQKALLEIAKMREPDDA
jgi:hypothetical protein